MSDHISALRAFITTTIVYWRSKDLKLFDVGELALVKNEVEKLKVK